MSARNGDRARFHKDRVRKLRHRQRVQLLLAAAPRRGAGSAPAGGKAPDKAEDGPPR